MSKKSIIDSVEVRNPCTEDWEEMTGTNKIRFCSHCSQHVNNISAMTRKEATRLIKSSGGNICVRYINDPVTGRPFYAKPVHQLTRRSPGIAAGVMTASIALSTQAFAQSTENDRPLPPVPAAEKILKQAAATVPEHSRGGRVTGTLVDAQGAVIGGASVELINEKTGEKLTQTTDSEGRYTIDNLESGTYSVRYSSPGFAPFQKSNVVVSDEPSDLQSTTLEVAGAVMMGVMVSTVTIEYKNPLTSAVQADDLDLVRQLITRGANVRQKEEDGTTALSVAVMRGNIESVRLLLNAGARINSADKANQTPLMHLDGDSSAKLAETLIRYGAKINARDKEGNSPLILASRSVSADVLKVLIDAGADVNAANKEGQTALMAAAEDDNIDKVRLLLLAGAEVNAKDSEDETAWDKTSDDAIEELLVSYGAKVKEESATPEKPVVIDR